jgi:hypothetical protein
MPCCVTLGGVTKEDWPRLAREVERRVSALGLTQAQIQERGGPSPAKLREVVNGRSATLSPSKRRDLERVLGWDAHSVDALLAGKDATISGVIRGRDGRVIQKFTRIDDGSDDQDEDIEVLRLAALIMDARDMVHSPTGPLTTALAIVMDEAAELATRAVARWVPGGHDIDDAKWRIDQVRAGGSIRRQGSVYVTDTESSSDQEEGSE